MVCDTMITVLMVDDEQIILNTLLSCIAWNSLGVEQVLTAHNGLEALDRMKEYPIDLLITDIRMPGLDGLTLLELVRIQYPSTHCILLTAYGEFEYAKKAFLLGIENYLLKPLSQEEMEETIEKAMDNIYSNRQSNRNLFLNNILFRWATGAISPEELGERAVTLNINIYQQYYCALCVQKHTRSFSYSSFYNYCREKANPTWDLYFFENNYDDFKSLIISGRQLSIQELTDFFTEITNSPDYRDSLTLFMGSIVESHTDLPLSYQTARRLLETTDLTAASNRIITSEPSFSHAMDQMVSELLSLFHISDPQTRTEAILKFSNELLNQKKYADAFGKLSKGILTLLRQEFPNNSNVHQLMSDRIHLLSILPENIPPVNTMAELANHGYLLYQHELNGFSPIIQRMIDYTQLHFSEMLSLQDFCAKYKMNTSYLGWLFKKETGVFYNNYLTQYRICRALQLLSETELSIHEIAERVGFSNTSYFTTCFKKQTGLTPNKYRMLQPGT